MYVHDDDDNDYDDDDYNDDDDDDDDMDVAAGAGVWIINTGSPPAAEARRHKLFPPHTIFSSSEF